MFDKLIAILKEKYGMDIIGPMAFKAITEDETEDENDPFGLDNRIEFIEGELSELATEHGTEISRFGRDSKYHWVLFEEL